MSRIVLLLAVVLSTPLLVGCDQGSAKNQQAASKMQSEIDKIRVDSDEKRLQELDSDGALSPDTQPIDDMASSIEQAAQNSSGKQAQVLSQQAELLRKIQGLVQPYGEKVNEFSAAGSISPTSFKTPEDFDERIAMLQELDAMNEEIDKKTPPLLRQLARIEHDAGVEKRLEIAGKIRDTDRRMFVAMNGMLEIMKAHWDQAQVTADGSILFGDDVPDELLQRYNDLFDQVQSAASEQGQLQRQLINLP